MKLKYFLPLVAFYGPGVLFHLAALSLGFSSSEVRGLTLFVGGVLGGSAGLLATIAVIVSEGSEAEGRR